MQYIIMCGGNYPHWQKPRQLTEINGEALVERTIRLLKECGVTDIAISTNDDVFKRFGVRLLKHENDYTGIEYNNHIGLWCSAFYPTKKPACYIFGDVFFSPEAIRTIVEYETDDIMFFASAPPFLPPYPKPYEEPFAFKVANQKHLREAIAEVKRIYAEGGFYREPIAWEVWNVISGGDPNRINYSSYVRINDYTCDIDEEREIFLIERIADLGGRPMAKKAETTKTTKAKATKAKPKKQKNELVNYKGVMYEVLERQGNRWKLTDGVIHFWVNSKDVTA